MNCRIKHPFELRLIVRIAQAWATQNKHAHTFFRYVSGATQSQNMAKNLHLQPIFHMHPHLSVAAHDGKKLEFM